MRQFRSTIIGVRGSRPIYDEGAIEEWEGAEAPPLVMLEAFVPRHFMLDASDVRNLPELRIGRGEGDADLVGFSISSANVYHAAHLFLRCPIVDQKQILPFANGRAQDDQPSVRAAVHCIRHLIEWRSARRAAVDSERHVQF